MSSVKGSPPLHSNDNYCHISTSCLASSIKRFHPWILHLARLHARKCKKIFMRYLAPTLQTLVNFVTLDTSSKSILLTSLAHHKTSVKIIVACSQSSLSSLSINKYNKHSVKGQLIITASSNIYSIIFTDRPNNIMKVSLISFATTIIASPSSCDAFLNILNQANPSLKKYADAQENVFLKIHLDVGNEAVVKKGKVGITGNRLGIDGLMVELQGLAPSDYKW